MAVARFGCHTLAGVWPGSRAWHLPELAEAAFRKGTGNGVVPELIEKAHDNDWKKKKKQRDLGKETARLRKYGAVLDRQM